MPCVYYKCVNIIFFYRNLDAKVVQDARAIKDVTESSPSAASRELDAAVEEEEEEERAPVIDLEDDKNNDFCTPLNPPRISTPQPLAPLTNRMGEHKQISLKRRRIVWESDSEDDNIDEL